ncbi:MAG: bifunctional oligoribonuclease/PAP phosphatase NrnA [Oscillospiraceae bacterium]|jgi:phosphoesterase RecJ-like protein|nr:bifunctional oligoribonuclease/PAP phosphatase NrnA [Oscillospiraceae bacterium]
MNISETAKWLSERDNYLIVTHRRPDGDTIGSAAGLARGLRGLGKTAYILYNPEITARYLPYAERYWAPDDFLPDNVVAVDTASHELFPVNWENSARRIALCIDHHPSNTGYAELSCIDGARASCGEIIFEILSRWPGAVDAEVAAALYVAVSTDTGCFAFGNTTADTLQVASELARAGAPIAHINRTMFRAKTRARAVLEGLIFSELEFHFDGRAAIAVVTKDMLARVGATENELDDIASLPGSIEGVWAGITIRELSGPDDCKVSVRSGENIDSNALCARFGGGGHPMAAGFTARARVFDIKAGLLAALDEILGGKTRP